MKPRVSVVITSMNDGERLVECVGSVLESGYPDLEVIVVDQGSSDGSVERVLRLYGGDERLRVLRLPRNVGTGLGRNLGALLSSGELLCFLDSDVKVSRGWLDPLVEEALRDGAVGACQSLILSCEDGSSPVVSRGVLDQYGCIYMVGDYRGGSGSQAVPTSLAAGGAALFKRRVFVEAGMHDNMLPYGYIDTDLSLRVLLLGYRILLVPRSRVYHPPTIGRRYREHEKVYYNVAGQLSLLIKVYEARRLLRVCPKLVAYMLALALAHAASGRPRMAIARVKALVKVLLSLRHVLAWRRRVQASRRVSDQQLYRMGVFVERDSYVERFKRWIAAW